MSIILVFYLAAFVSRFYKFALLGWKGERLGAWWSLRTVTVTVLAGHSELLLCPGETLADLASAGPPSRCPPPQASDGHMETTAHPAKSPPCRAAPTVCSALWRAFFVCLGGKGISPDRLVTITHAHTPGCST
jgi:hypothetical protein